MKHLSFLDIQETLQKLWKEEETFRFHYNNATKESIFSIDVPPPTFSGKLHIGHIFSYTQTDFEARYQRGEGKKVFYPFGFDDNGLPTERYLEQEKGISSKDYPRKKFMEKCIAEIKDGHESFRTLFNTMALSVDWSLCYSTISKEIQQLTQKFFIELYNKKMVYRRNDPVLYCTAFRTSVAQAEIELIERNSKMITIPFKNIDDEKFYIPVATTRPELLVSCVKIFVHPDDQRYKDYVGKNVYTPIYNQIVSISSDEKVLPEKGTGAVMCCTFGDSLDVAWFKKYSLPFIESIGKDGKMMAIAQVLEGLSIKEAREKIISLLQEKNLIIEAKEVVQSVAIYERSKKEVEYMIQPQWYVKLLDYKERFIQLADEIAWHPKHMKYRYLDWIEKLQWDWCISRQRIYGIPFPVWYDNKNNSVISDENDLPIDPLSDLPKNCTLPLRGDPDVMDTWNTSSLTPFICLALFKKALQREKITLSDKEIKKIFFPMSMRPQAHDIIRTWAFDTIVKSWMHDKGNIPWKKIIISGHVITANKQKISKSLKNTVMEPEILLKKYPVDAIRYWAASAKLGTDIVFSEEQIKIGEKLITKIINVGEFFTLHKVITSEKEEENSEVYRNELYKNGAKLLHNQWLLHELQECYKKYSSAFNDHEFGIALESVEQSFRTVLCDHHIEISKGLFFDIESNNEESLFETKYIATSALLAYIKLLSPFLVYTTEWLYQKLFKNINTEKKSIHTIETSFCLTPIIEIGSKKISDIEQFQTYRSLIKDIRSYKSDKKKSLKEMINQVTIHHYGTTPIFSNIDLQLLKKSLAIKNIVIKRNEKNESQKNLSPLILSFE